MIIHKNTPLKDVLKLGNSCQQCGNCCSYGTGFATEEDMIKMAHKLGITAAKLKKEYMEEMEKFQTKMHRPKTIKQKGKPYGKCVFLKEKKCSIHDVKPLQCKIGNCSTLGDALVQWFDLNFFVNTKDPQSIREWAQVLVVREPIKGGSLQELVPNKAMLKDILEHNL